MVIVILVRLFLKWGIAMNNIISEWLGECRHKDEWGKGWLKLDVPEHVAMIYECQTCKLQAYVDMQNGLPKAPDYTSDPSAWGPDMYQKIEDAGLVETFMIHVRDITFDERWRLNHLSDFAIIKATPQQKSAALVAAIQEVGNADKRTRSN